METVGYAQQGLSATEIKDARELDVIQDRLRGLLERQHALRARYVSVMDRLQGVQSLQEGGSVHGGGEMPCEGILPEINSVIEALEHVTLHLEETANRAERL